MPRRSSGSRRPEEIEPLREHAAELVRVVADLRATAATAKKRIAELEREAVELRGSVDKAVKAHEEAEARFGEVERSLGAARRD